MKGTKTHGISLIEVVIGVSIAGLILIFSTQAIILFVNTNRTVGEKTKAVYLLEDGLEHVRYLRDGSWSTISSLSISTNYFLALSGSSMSITTATQTIDGYTRSFRIQNVYRNGSDDVVASTTSGATADSSAKYITMNVTWGNPTTTLTLTEILTEIDP
jgi:type II secretory pathway pseudopilin PulG